MIQNIIYIYITYSLFGTQMNNLETLYPSENAFSSKLLLISYLIYIQIYIQIIHTCDAL